MLTGSQFDLWWTVLMVVVEVVWAGFLLWPFITDYRVACRERDDLMAVARAVFGPDRERIP